jgi:hypothetical protein
MGFMVVKARSTFNHTAQYKDIFLCETSWLGLIGRSSKWFKMHNLAIRVGSIWTFRSGTIPSGQETQSIIQNSRTILTLKGKFLSPISEERSNHILQRTGDSVRCAPASGNR